MLGKSSSPFRQLFLRGHLAYLATSPLLASQHVHTSTLWLLPPLFSLSWVNRSFHMMQCNIPLQHIPARFESGIVLINLWTSTHAAPVQPWPIFHMLAIKQARLVLLNTFHRRCFGFLTCAFEPHLEAHLFVRTDGCHFPWFKSSKREKRASPSYRPEFNGHMCDCSNCSKSRKQHFTFGGAPPVRVVLNSGKKSESV